METTTQVKQRHAVVTGVSSGIGLTITQRLLTEGFGSPACVAGRQRKPSSV